MRWWKRWYQDLKKNIYHTAVHTHFSLRPVTYTFVTDKTFREINHTIEQEAGLLRNLRRYNVLVGRCRGTRLTFYKFSFSAKFLAMSRPFHGYMTRKNGKTYITGSFRFSTATVILFVAWVFNDFWRLIANLGDHEPGNIIGHIISIGIILLFWGRMIWKDKGTQHSIIDFMEEYLDAEWVKEKEQHMREAKLWELGRLYHSYRKDFPPEERAPALLLLYHIYVRHSMELVVLEGSDGKAAAYAINFRDKRYGCVLISFLATLAENRSMGCGTRFLQEMRQYYSDAAGLIVEIEQCGKGKTKTDNQNRARRLRFYEKNGFIMQKPREVLGGVEMNLMYLPIRKNTLGSSFDCVMHDIYTQMLGNRLRDKYVKFLEE